VDLWAALREACTRWLAEASATRLPLPASFSAIIDVSGRPAPVRVSISSKPVFEAAGRGSVTVRARRALGSRVMMLVASPPESCLAMVELPGYDAIVVCGERGCSGTFGWSDGYARMGEPVPPAQRRAFEELALLASRCTEAWPELRALLRRASTRLLSLLL